VRAVVAAGAAGEVEDIPEVVLVVVAWIVGKYFVVMIKLVY
jgi:hypothetical protein